MKKRMFTWMPDWIGAGVVAGMVWGGWAFFVNYEHGFNVALTAFCVQGLMSFVLASIVTSMVAYFMCISSFVSIKHFLAVSIPFVLVFFFQLCAHLIAETPNILTTILPSVSAAGIWCFIYANKLSKFEKEVAINE